MKEYKQQKEKILVDLDVVTVAIWNKKSEQTNTAKRFLKRIEKKEFYFVTPLFLIELALKWKHKGLSEDINKFYVSYSDKIISITDFREKCTNLKINAENIIKSLEEHEVKEEDSVLVIFTSIFDLNYLITFNRKHLRNKKNIINRILEENGLKTIEIIGPEEI